MWYAMWSLQARCLLLSRLRDYVPRTISGPAPALAYLPASPDMRGSRIGEDTHCTLWPPLRGSCVRISRAFCTRTRSLGPFLRSCGSLFLHPIRINNGMSRAPADHRGGGLDTHVLRCMYHHSHTFPDARWASSHMMCTSRVRASSPGSRCVLPQPLLVQPTPR
jgi:hypothetical protein